ncbi:hypothetical protein KUV80_00610 [Fictibacillus nanhaiensis]|uniref:hypothetical protein n=1 Tax=Fictibacillus nanhaiensis TaxID=742169 RepID=UPI001C98B1A0|nr:hypothetical protein [Fictibacillus nanhaiensis]MBY6035132.1 hypothetical protein [Fictibacillus nanhaiensis]
MAQLVKIQDYVSRYEKNLYHYQSLFMRIKENRWKEFLQVNEEKKNKSLKKDFRKQLFHHQVKWVSSTVKEISNFQPKYMKSKALHFLTEEIPDNYFLFYEPVLLVKGAPIELDIILVGPASVWLIVWMDGEGIWNECENKRFWKNIDPEHIQTKLSPVVRLERMSHIIGEWVQPFQQQLTLRQAIIAPEAFIDLPNDWRKLTCIDKRTFKGWKTQVNHEPAPVKSQQLKCVSAILENGLTNSLYRKDPLTKESEVSFEGI